MTRVPALAPLGRLREPLEALGALLAAAGEHVHLVVVGGVAILVRGVRSRATADVDVIARGEIDATGTLRLVAPDPLPTVVQDSVARVARDFGLPGDWLNTVIGRQWRHGPNALPPALAEEATWYTLGGLHLGIAGRRALIALKLYAAVGTGRLSVHTQDLLALAPNDAELTEAGAWVRMQDASEGFAAMLEDVIRHVQTHCATEPR